MGYRLSLLEKSPVDGQEGAAAALQRTLALAQSAERWGFHRFWLSEHHNNPQLAISSPEITIAWILAQTRRIRVGSGGVMLQHYSPFKVAENFNQLASLAPGRVDLGVGKAPGGLPLSTRELQQGIPGADFPARLQQLTNWLLSPAAANEPDSPIVTPVPPEPAERFLLGASVATARLAAESGWQFVFAAQLNGSEEEISSAIGTYHRLSHGRKALLAVPVVVADSKEQAEDLLGPRQQFRLTDAEGHHVSVGSLEQAEAWIRQSGGGPHDIEERPSLVLTGTTAQVHRQLATLQARYGIDEFVIDTPISNATARLASLTALASGYDVLSGATL
ncbi:MsnO8 family LLM class oxidoreductase [Pantoea sp. CCBC3-3-1]|uniref:MsnO8 family LLM class oxidoreductase n=1 Tax=Pantoea sp. CCBC3-3-1 TaxID=2490851 RepID=UPI0011BDE39E|nr:MsnO8 family LLM class oxidoreductase [Pantoea sp. CCBC3-3-1]